MFLIVHAEFIDVCIVLTLYKVVHAMMLKAKYKFYVAAMLFQIVQTYFLVKTFIISKDSQENANLDPYC
jgi:hypothetical protein